MIKTICIVLFLCGIFLFLLAMGISVADMVLNFIIRSLYGLILIGITNIIIAEAGANLAVKMNEYTATVSGVLGVSGVALLYAIETYCTYGH